jgi:integration host factor subunit beta
MNLSDLAAKLSEKENLTQKEADAVVKLIFCLFTDALVKGDRIEIRGFGSFEMREYKNYTGRNPKTGRDVDVKSKRLPYFKVGKELKEKVNGSSS